MINREEMKTLEYKKYYRIVAGSRDIDLAIANTVSKRNFRLVNYYAMPNVVYGKIQ